MMDSTFDMEEGEWARINRDLRHHGLPSVDILDPRDSDGTSDIVMFTSDGTKTLRQTLETLVRDCDRRQELIQELIVTNNQLREELKTQTQVTDKFERQSRDLKIMLEESRSRAKHVERELSGVTMATTEEGERLRNTKEAATARCNQLMQKCEMYEKDVDRMQKKLKLLNLEDANRRKKQEEVLSQMRKNISRGGATDDNVATVIDWYENQISQLKRELQMARGNETFDVSDYHGNVSGYHDNSQRSGFAASQIEGGTSNYKALIKSYERQLRDAKKKMKDLENEKELLKLDMESRPQLKDFRDSQARVKKLERALKNNGICPSHEVKQSKKAGMLFSTKVEDIEFLPVVQCRAYLKSTCTDLGVTDLKELPSTLDNVSKSTTAFPQLEQFASSVLSIVNKSTSPRKKQVTHATWCEKSMHRALTMLESWSRQIHANKELQESIHRLSASLYPWKQLNHLDNPTTMQMVTLLDSLQEEGSDNITDPNSQKSSKEQPSRGGVKEQPTQEMLRGIVRHFQQLFDVPHVSGVYARMNDVYTKLGEVHNILKTLRDLLGLDPSCKPSVIVDAVAKLRESQPRQTPEQIHQRLSSEDLDSLMQRLDDHDEFFPVFEDLLQKLLEILNVHQLDEVLPAVKALKLLAGC